MLVPIVVDEVMDGVGVGVCAPGTAVVDAPVLESTFTDDDDDATVVLTNDESVVGIDVDDDVSFDVVVVAAAPLERRSRGNLLGD